MIDGQGHIVLLDLGEGAEGHRAAIGGAEEDMFQIIGAILKFGLHFQHHAVLIELGEPRRDLPLAEGAVQSVIDHLGRDAEREAVSRLITMLVSRPWFC